MIIGEHPSGRKIKIEWTPWANYRWTAYNSDGSVIRSDWQRTIEAAKEEARFHVFDLLDYSNPQVRPLIKKRWKWREEA